MHLKILATSKKFCKLLQISVQYEYDYYEYLCIMSTSAKGRVCLCTGRTSTSMRRQSIRRTGPPPRLHGTHVQVCGPPSTPSIFAFSALQYHRHGPVGVLWELQQIYIPAGNPVSSFRSSCSYGVRDSMKTSSICSICNRTTLTFGF